MAEFKQQEIKVVKEGDPIDSDRAAIRYSVRIIHNIVQNLDAMMELEDRKNPDSVIALKVKEENEIYSLFDEVSKLSKYLVYHGLWKEDYNGLCLGIKNRLFTEEKTAKVVNYVCDHCGFWLTDGIMDYCPGCGAKLEWKNEEH